MSVRAATLLLDTLQLKRYPDPERLGAAWKTVDTKGLSRLIHYEGCALWLRRRLSDLNAMESADRRVSVWVEHRSREMAARNMLVDAQTDRVVRLLSDAAIPFVLIKGAARRALADTIPYADARATNDVDILVAAGSARHAWEHLRDAGYELAERQDNRSAVTAAGHFHLETLWDRLRVAVELHTSTSLTVAPDEAWKRAISAARYVERAGRLVPIQSCPTELLWHAVTHALDHGAKGFRLHFLLDATVILAAGMPVDWSVIERRLETREVRNRYYALQWLGAAATFAGARLPYRIGGGVTSFDLEVVLGSRLALLRRVTAGNWLSVKVLDRIPNVIIAADRWILRPTRLIAQPIGSRGG
jgi:hypothetical protein